MAIDNIQELDARLKNKPHSISVAIAARAALRVTPLLVGGLAVEVENSEESFLFPLLRCNASALLYGVDPDEAVLSNSGNYRARSAATKADTFARAAAAAKAAATSYDAVEAIDAAANATFLAATMSDATVSLRAFWSAVSRDIDFLEVNEITASLLQKPLWHDAGEPVWSIGHWSTMCEFLSKSKINWSVWTDWWEARRDGKPYNFEMEREIVLIPDEAWENGPAHINSLIAHIRARYARIAESQDRALRAVLDTDVAIVAIAEFDYNRIDHVMRMLPFADELARIDTPSCVSLLSELRDAAQDLSDDIQKSQAPLPLKRTIKRYAEEAARDPDAVRPGRLHDLARLLRKARANEDIMGAMPELADEALRQFVDRHLELMRSILANTMARMERTENISFAMEGSAENVAEGLARGADAIRNAIWKAVPRASDEAAAIMKDISEEILEIAQERDTAATPEKRAARQAELDEKAKIGGSTMIRYSLRAVQATAGSVNLAAAGKTLWPETFDVALKMVVEQFVGFKLPWS